MMDQANAKNPTPDPPYQPQAGLIGIQNMPRCQEHTLKPDPTWAKHRSALPAHCHNIVKTLPQHRQNIATYSPNQNISSTPHDVNKPPKPRETLHKSAQRPHANATNANKTYNKNSWQSHSSSNNPSKRPASHPAMTLVSYPPSR